MDNENIIQELKKVVNAEDEVKLNSLDDQKILNEKLQFLNNLKQELFKLNNVFTNSKSDLEVSYYVKTDIEKINSDFRSIVKEIFECCNDFCQTNNQLSTDKTVYENRCLENEKKFNKIEISTKEKISFLQNRITQLINEDEAIQQEQQQLIDKGKNENDELEIELTFNEDEFKKLEIEFNGLTNDDKVMETELQCISENIDQLAVKRNESENEINKVALRLAEIENATEEELHNSICEMKKSMINLQTDISNSNETLKSCNEYIPQLIQTVKYNELQHNSLLNEINNLEKYISEASFFNIFKQNADKGTSEKQNLIEQRKLLLQADNDAVVNIIQAIDEMKEKLSNLNGGLNNLNSELEIIQNQKPNLLQATEDTVNRNAILKTSIEELLTEMKQDQDIVNQKQSALNELMKNRDAITSDTNTKIEQIQSNFASEICILQNEITEIENSNKIIQTHIEDNEKSMNEIKKNELEMDEEIDKIENQRKDIENKCGAIFTEIREYKAKIKQLENERKKESRSQSLNKSFAKPDVPKMLVQTNRNRNNNNNDSDSSVDEKFNEWRRSKKDPAKK